MAKALGNLLLSTLRETVEAMGGNLSRVAEFPDRASRGRAAPDYLANHLAKMTG